LLLAVSWRPFASYQVWVNFVVFRGVVVGDLALFFIKHEIETHYDVDNRSNDASHCKTASVYLAVARGSPLKARLVATAEFELGSDRRIELEELRARRNLLFNQFVEHPSDIRMSLEIKKIDDQIAEFTERMEPRKGTKR
jgi:hypothetical protein